MKKTMLVLLVAVWAISKTIAQPPNGKKVVIVTSNQHTYGTTKLNAANHFEEIVVAYDVFVKAGYEVHFVSPLGGAIPIGYLKTSDSIQKKYFYDALLINKLKNTFTPTQIVKTDYSAIYFSGGGAAMFGVPENAEIQEIAKTIFAKGGIVSAVCHGTAGIVKIKDDEGNYLFKDRNITGYPDAFERKDADYYTTFPFSIEQTINANGAIFQYSKKGWDGFYVVDDRLITGQDPTSSAKVAQLVVDKLMKIENQ
ncbi:MAG: type 1 glutamine amidotransferase domain-containing protein [Bacteroidota bacterium]